MRIIKFRAWDSHNKEMINPYCELKENNHFWGEDMTNTHYVSPVAVMQFTGLLDRHGVEIYEGDVVMWKDGSEDPQHWRYAEVIYQPKSLCYHFRIVKCGELETGYVFKNNFGGYHELKVIGNIYENPELIKQ